jgi:16S rRNA (adenine1518-N6/adenine1519-N6)-dimethyltransferase
MSIAAKEGRGGGVGFESPSAVLRRYGLHAKKSWGQCFLHDASALSRIVDAASICAEDTVVEIGSGLGTLTSLLAARARRVLAIERDRDLAGVLRQEFSQNPKIEVREEDALRFDFSTVGSGLIVVGNLPYNIASPLVFHLLDQREQIRSATLMLQLEVAERLAAKPGSRACGVPTLLCQQAADLRLCFVVRSGAFVPRPRVDSAVVRLEMRSTPRVDVDEVELRRVIEAAFGHRRKTLRRALASSFAVHEVEAALERSGIDGSRRGETLSLEEFGGLTRALFETE